MTYQSEIAYVGRPAVRRIFSSHRKWLGLGALLALLVGDTCMISVAASIACLVRNGAFVGPHTSDLIVAVIPLYLVAAFSARAYNLQAIKSTSSSFQRAELALAVAAVLTFTAAFAFKVGANYSRLEIAYLFTASAFLIGIERIFFALTLGQADILKEQAVLVTDVPEESRQRKDMAVIDVRGYRLAADDPDFLDSLFRQFEPYDRIILSFRDAESRNAWASIMNLTGLEAEVSDPFVAAMAPLSLRRWDDQPTLLISRGPLTLKERVFKRAFDLALVLMLAPIALPLALIIAVAIKLDSKGPVLFHQTRVGRNNGQFDCRKFRTMRIDSVDADGHRSTARDDDRVTKVGAFLRKTSLDELPQLWNVLLGEMSLVGPRPHALGSRAEGSLFWEASQGYWKRHAVKPGLTGLAQVRGFRGATHTRRELELRVAADLEYINRWSPWLDINILARTVMVIVHRNAY